MEHIQSKRDCVPGVTAIYFVEPTEQNVSLILDVLVRGGREQQDFTEIKSFVGAESCIDRCGFIGLVNDRIIYCGMDDASGESCLYDKVALRFKGGMGEKWL